MGLSFILADTSVYGFLDQIRQVLATKHHAGFLSRRRDDKLLSKLISFIEKTNPSETNRQERNSGLHISGHKDQYWEEKDVEEGR